MTTMTKLQSRVRAETTSGLNYPSRVPFQASRRTYWYSGQVVELSAEEYQYLQLEAAQQGKTFEDALSEELACRGLVKRRISRPQWNLVLDRVENRSSGRPIEDEAASL